MLRNLALSLGLTLLLEELFALVWGLRGRRELSLVALVNCLTNPAAVLSVRTAVYRLGTHTLPATLAVEAAVIGIEWSCYRQGSGQLRHPFLFVLLCNGFSYGIGALLNRIL